MLHTLRLTRSSFVLAAMLAAAAGLASGSTPQKSPPDAKPARPTDAKPHKRSEAVDQSIHDGLCWLARHQNPDGSWSATKLAEHCDSPASIYRPQRAYPTTYDAGLSGLTVLAFVGAMRGSNTAVILEDPTNGARHDVRAIVKRGLDRILAHQRSDGSFARDRVFMYREALATQAVCEAYSVLGDASVADRAQKAIDFVQSAQRPSPTGKGLWGWRYASRREVEDYHARKDPKSAAARTELSDADTSITGRCMSALRAGAKAGLTVKKEHLAGAMQFVRFASSVTEDDRPTGLVGYYDAKSAGMKVTGPHDDYAYHPAVMSALGILVLLDGGTNAKDPFFAAAAAQILKDQPEVTTDNLSVDYYYWLNATRALSRLGGPASTKREKKSWPAWNTAVTESLMAIQDRTAQQCTHGGWLVEDRWTFAHGGPIYTTAFAVLTLQECE